MKKLLVFYPALFMCLIGGNLLSAQTDTLLISATDGEGNLITNALLAIVADTSASGEQLNDVYRLERGKTYFYNQSPVFENPITLVAYPPGTTAETRPPKIMVANNDEGWAPYEHCITTFADLTVKNIAFSTTSVEGSYTWANAILLQSDGLRIVLEGCHFTLTGWGILEAAVDNTVFIVDRCHIRNATVYDYGDEWCPFFFEIDVGSADTLIATNNTWFNMQGSVVNIEQQNFVRYFLFDHNTLVNVVKGFTPLVSHLESIVTNNIFYNVEPHSVLINQVESSEDSMALSVINVDTLISNEPGSTLEAPTTEKERKFTLSYNCYFFSQGVQDYWTKYATTGAIAGYDTVITPGTPPDTAITTLYDYVVPVEWMNPVTQAMFDDDASYPHFIAYDNVNVDPGFTNFGGTDSMVAGMNQHRDGEGFGFWGWDPDEDWAMLQWPLPEDFSYSASITGSDGYHIGSLEYYPDELAGYLSTEKTDNAVPTEFSLRQNYPNPFNPVTTIDYQINTTGDVKIVIYNLLGQEIKTLVNGSNIAAGSYSVVWDGTDRMGQKVSNGIYFYRLQVGAESKTNKMILLK
ncbi:hypothetical protein ES703_14343 [subsurface metagenome]